MAKARKNSIMAGVSGQVGDQMVFRQSNGQTIMSAKYKYKDNPTDHMMVQRILFEKAAKLAKETIKDPKKRRHYEAQRRPGQTAYNVAVSEIFQEIWADHKHIPLVKKPKVRKSRKKPVESILNKGITLLIDTNEGTLVESGVKAPDEQFLEWIYNAAKSKTSHHINTIVVRINCA